VAGTGVVLASLTSALINLPIVQRQAKNPALSRRLAAFTVGLAILGIAVLVVREYRWLLRI
jgi:threonine/homoserine efflux transporter RhtA